MTRPQAPIISLIFDKLIWSDKLSLGSFGVFPGIAMFIWGNKKGIIISVGCLIAYYGFSKAHSGTFQ